VEEGEEDGRRLGEEGGRRKVDEGRSSRRRAVEEEWVGERKS
jgi:hypothetical protein